MEHNENLRTDFYKYLNNQLRAAQAKQLLSHMQSGRDKETFLNLIEESLDSEIAEQLLSKPELLSILNQSLNKINLAIEGNQKPIFARLWPRIAIAAAVAMIIFGAGLFYFKNQSVKQNQATQYAGNIAPGKNGATLTLSNGTKILINDALAGNIASQSGVKISKTKNGQLIYELSGTSQGSAESNTLSTSMGQQIQVRLPDGSLVYLNAASSLKYPANFSEQEKRRVTLSGEGYFEVAKDKAHPFIVTTDRQTIEVLGTHFNINSYADEKEVKTTLLEGSVKVAAINNASMIIKERILKPGEQSILTARGINTVQVNADEVMAWQKGYFRFYDEDIESIMRKISRWYNVQVEFQGKVPKEGFTARITKYSSITDVLETLENTKAVHFKIEGRKIIVSE